MAMDISNCQTSEFAYDLSCYMRVGFQLRQSWTGLSSSMMLTMMVWYILVRWLLLWRLWMILMESYQVIWEEAWQDNNDLSGEIRYDSNGNPEPLPTAFERAESLFSALDRDNDGCLTKKEFMSGYSKRSLILKRQDADDQKRKLNCLILYGPLLNREVSFVYNMVHSNCLLSSRLTQVAALTSWVLYLPSGLE